MDFPRGIWKLSRDEFTFSAKKKQGVMNQAEGSLFKTYNKRNPQIEFQWLCHAILQRRLEILYLLPKV